MLSKTTGTGACVTALLDNLSGVHWHCQGENMLEQGFRYADLFGYLNPLRSTPLQVVNRSAMEWLYRLGDSELRQSPCFTAGRVAAVIVCNGLTVNPSIQAICEENGISLISTILDAGDTLDFLQKNVPPLFLPRGNKHGVFLAVMNTGVLITGASGVGKSEVALDLVQRGHQLIADDAVEIYRRDSRELIGKCSPILKGYVEIRGLGIINIEKMFGPASVLDSYPLQLMINLEDATNTEIRNLDRLQPSMDQVEVLGVEVPCLNILVEPGRNLSVLVEAATRDHLLRMSGVDSSLEFISRHDRVMAESGPSQPPAGKR